MATVIVETLADAIATRRFSQRCADCGLVEAAGYYCSKCLRRTQLVDVYQAEIAANRRWKK